MSVRPPPSIRTPRLLLRPWRREDASGLRPVLRANVQHLRNWIPARVAAPAPLPRLEARLARFAADLDAGRSWRFAIFARGERDVLGEVSVFFRDADGRVGMEAADRLEIGYWLRHDATGRGYATEATRAMLDLAAGIPDMIRVEIRCDPRNQPSAAVPRRLGFRLDHRGAGHDGGSDPHTMVWVLDLPLPYQTVRPGTGP